MYQTRALQKTYVIDVMEDGQNRLNFNIPAFQCALSSLRLLMNIGMGKEEEQMLEECLRSVSGMFLVLSLNNRVYKSL